MRTSWRSCSVWRKSRSCAGRNGGRFHRFVLAQWFALTLKQSLAGCSNKGSSLCPLRRGHGDPPRTIQMVAGSLDAPERKENLGCGSLQPAERTLDSLLFRVTPKSHKAKNIGSIFPGTFFWH